MFAIITIKYNNITIPRWITIAVMINMFDCFALLAGSSFFNESPKKSIFIENEISVALEINSIISGRVWRGSKTNQNGNRLLIIKPKMANTTPITLKTNKLQNSEFMVFIVFRINQKTIKKTPWIMINHILKL